MTWWMEHILLNVLVFLLVWCACEGDMKQTLKAYLVFILAFYACFLMLYIIVVNGGHLTI